MSVHDRERWDAKYAERPLPEVLVPDPWLERHASALPPGRALDLACGLGQNAVWLARQGWRVDGIDISPRGLALAQQLAAREQQVVNWQVGDLDEFSPEPEAYDLVLVFRFLERQRLPGVIEAALAPGGCLVYETFLRGTGSGGHAPFQNPEWLLMPGELPGLFPHFEVVESVEQEIAAGPVARYCGRKRSR